MTILIIGGGKMGMSHLALVTQYVGKSKVALCERKRIIRLLFCTLGYRTFSSVDHAAASLDQLDGVLIATPTPSHAQLARWAIERKVPFFVEKPLTLDVVQSSELVELADKAGVISQVGFVLRYVATFQRLRGLVADNSLGRLHSYTASMRGGVISRSPQPESWQGDFKRGGGCLNEYGPHIIDLCRFIFGHVDQVDSVEMGQIHCEKADDWVGVSWTHSDGTKGSIDINWCDPTKRKSVIEIHARFDHADVRVDNSAFDIEWHRDCGRMTEIHGLKETRVQPPNVSYYLRGEEFSLEIEDFVSTCLQRNGHTHSCVTPRLTDGREVDSLIDGIARRAGLK